MMPSLLDRYLVRETLLPFVLSLLLITFLLIIPPILTQGYALIAQGVQWSVVARVFVTLLPQALSISIPMAVLMGLLIAFGRLSADREFVAMQACGVSVYRLLRPVAFIALVATAITGYVLIVSLPNANQTFREITTQEVASLVENNVKPRVFFNSFPNRVLYVRDLPAGGGWRDIFLADSSRPGETNVYFARDGRILVDREKKLVQLQLLHGTQHQTLAAQPDQYQGTDFESISLNLDPQTVFPPPPSRGVPEMTIADLRRTIVDAEKRGDTILGYSSRFMIQYKFSFPVACCVLALIGLALGFSNRKDGKLASFVIGISVSFVYYVLLYMARAAAMGGVMSADLAPWIPPLVLGVAGIALLFWRARSTDRPILITLPLRRASAQLAGAPGVTIPMIDLPAPSARAPKVLFVIRVPHFSLPWSILDVYTSRQYLRVFVLTVLASLGVFYISTFIDLADKLFRGAATTALLLQFFYYQTPQYVYYIIPIAGLVATLVTIGTMTKNSELVVMRACGVSLYRTAVPLLLFAVASSGVLFAMQELVLARANQEADRLNSIIRGFPAQTISELNRWVASEKGDVYHYDFFDQRADRFARFTLYHLDQPAWRLSAITYAENVSPAPPSAGGAHGPEPVWKARNGWVRTVTLRKTKNVVKTAVTYEPFAERDLPLEPPRYFKTETPDAQKMTYGQLNDYITQLKASGFNAIPPMVQLQRKVAFPFVTVIMTLLAVPFAVTTGRRGALGGIGIGIALSIVYWVVLSIFGALGEGGVTTPLLAAWAPNILFGAAALYMVLTVRT
jgi:lipopolysaccharide export system permease protein